MEEETQGVEGQVAPSTRQVKTSCTLLVFLFKQLLDVGVLHQAFEEETEGVGRQFPLTCTVKTILVILILPIIPVTLLQRHA